MRRKIVALMLAGVMATSFTACGGSSASDSSSQKTSNSNSVSQKKEESSDSGKAPERIRTIKSSLPERKNQMGLLQQRI